MPTTLSQYFLKTAIYQGSGTIAMLPDMLSSLGAKRAVLFTDEGIVASGVLDKVKTMFELPGKGLACDLAGVFDKVPQDAEMASVNEGARFFRERAADALVALGGGSVLDFAKGVKYLIYKGEDDIRALMPGNMAIVTWPKAEPIPIPHVAINTTAGTGAEISPIAVIYNAADKVKGVLIHPFLNSDVTILDPDLTTGMPKEFTAGSGFDALTHAIEGIASPGAFGISDANGFEAIKTINRRLPVVLEEPGNVSARNDMLGASAMAIISFFYSGMSQIPVHNFAHAFGGKYRVPHGYANGVFLTHVMDAMPELYLPKVKDLAKAFDLEDLKKEPDGLLSDVISRIRQLQKLAGIPEDLKSYNIPKTALDDMTKAVMMDPSGILFPIPEETIRKVIQRVI
jgi:alcohol dehydrogenase class IV